MMRHLINMVSSISFISFSVFFIFKMIKYRSEYDKLQIEVEHQKQVSAYIINITFFNAYSYSIYLLNYRSKKINFLLKLFI